MGRLDLGRVLDRHSKTAVDDDPTRYQGQGPNVPASSQRVARGYQPKMSIWDPFQVMTNRVAKAAALTAHYV